MSRAISSLLYFVRNSHFYFPPSFPRPSQKILPKKNTVSCSLPPSSFAKQQTRRQEVFFFPLTGTFFFFLLHDQNSQGLAAATNYHLSFATIEMAASRAVVLRARNLTHARRQRTFHASRLSVMRSALSRTVGSSCGSRPPR